MDERPAFSIRALPTPAMAGGEANRHMCLSSMDYPYVMQQRMIEGGFQSYSLPKYTDYIKGDTNGCKDVGQDSIH